MAIKTMIQALNEALRLAMEKDARVVVLGEDVGVDGGVFRVTEGLLKQFGSARVLDTPLAESGMVGACVGMSVAGLKPIAEIQFSGFIYPAMNQIVNHVARMRNRSRGRFTTSMVIRAPHEGGVKALEHHAESMESMFLQSPGVKVVIPSTPHNAKGLLLAAIESKDPVIFLEPLKLYRSIKEDVPDAYYTTPIGKARIARSGNDVTIVTYGSLVKTCVEAAENVSVQRLGECEVIDLMTLSPMDFETIQQSVNKTGRLLVVHEAPQSAGIGAEVAARVSERCMMSLKGPIVRVTGFDVVIPLAKMENLYIPDVNRVVKGIKQVLEY